MTSPAANPTTKTSAQPPISAERSAAVARAREGWIKKLIDISRNNNLLYFRDLKTGTLDLSQAAAPAFASLLRGEAVSFSRLLPEGDQTNLAARLLQIQRRAVANLEERGLETLYLALGMATWPANDGGRPSEAAILLAPIAIESRGARRPRVYLAAQRRSAAKSRAAARP